MGWTAVRQPGSAAWTGRRCAIGSTASTPPGRRVSSTTRPKAPSRACRLGSWLIFAAIVEAGPDRERDGVVRWRRSRSQARHRGALRRRLPRAPRRQASEEARLLPYERTASRRLAGDDADRDLVSGRGPHRPEERPGSTVGQARDAASPAGRPTLRQRLSVRGHLSGARRRRGARLALRRHRGDAAPPRRDLPSCRPGRSRCAAARPRRMAHDRRPRGAREHHADLPALARSRTEPGRERLAVSPLELALQRNHPARPALCGFA